MSSRILLLLTLCLFTVSQSAVTVTEFYQDAPKYFPANTFDTVDTTAFRAQALGSFKYSVATWFKISRTVSNGNYHMMLHLTALDVEFPWDSNTYTNGIRHLANLISIRLDVSARRIAVNVGTFNDANRQVTMTNNYDILATTNCWNYVYVGVNHETGQAYFGMNSQGCLSANYFPSATALTGTYSNEALDERATLYLGGSKNHITTQAATTGAWPGSLYRTMFLNGFYTADQQTIRRLMGGETKNMYFFYMDNKVVQQVIPSAKDPNSYLTLGSSSSDLVSDPSLNGWDGMGILSASDQQLSITLSKELGDYNFISFWVKIDNSSPASNYQNILSIRTASNAEFLSVIFDKTTTTRVRVRRGAVFGTDQTITLQAWNFCFLTFNYLFGDSSSSIMASFSVNNVPVMANTFLSGSVLPADLVKPLSVLYLGKVPGAAENTINGYLRNVIGGSGTYFEHNTASTTCLVSIGLQNPYCLYCNPSSSLYSNPQGACVSTCPAGTYQDTRTYTCTPCDATCATCNGAGPASCTTCAEDTPIYFQAMCFSECPPGSLKNLNGGCDCDPTCSGCPYDDASKTAKCVGCALNTLYLLPDKSKCVLPTQCPVGTVANQPLLSCAFPSVNACPVATPVPDYSNGICAAFCPMGTVKVTTPSAACYTKCPDGYYKTDITPSVAGETDKGCTPCTGTCKTCTSATSCLTCTGLNLFHEDINTCAATCSAGFSFTVPGYFCKACRKSCTACSPILYLLPGATPTDNTCVDNCPLGMTADGSRTCIASTQVDATIVNKTATVPIIRISRKQNLVLIGDYASPATVTEVLWYLDSTDTALKTQFFKGVSVSNKNLVIPVANLKADTTYKVMFKVSDSVPSTETEFVQVKTDAAIAPGTFTVSPLEGTAFQTQFTLTIAGFSATAGLKFDITSFFERTQVINGKNYVERVETISIALGVDQGTYTFIYPISTVKKPYKIEICGYTDYEQTCLTQSITLLPSGDLPLQKVLVWNADATTLTTLDRMLDFVRSISLFYTRDWANQITSEYARGALLIDNLAVTKNLVACNKIAECSNAGACQVSGSTFTCKCELGYGGFNCFYGEREFATVSIRVRDILTNLYSVSLDISNVEKAVLILQELTNTLDMVEYNSLFFFRDIMSNVLKVPNLKKQHFNPIFNVLAEVIGFVKRSLTGTWFKPVDRSLLLVSLTGLVDTAFGLLDGIRMTDPYFLVDTNFLKVMVVNNVAGTFLGTTSGSSFSVDWETFGFTFPAELMRKLPTASIKMLGYKINPYSDSQTNGQITSVMKVEVYDVNGPVAVSGLSSTINLRIPKLAATPVFTAKTSAGAYNCEYKSSTVRSKINFASSGCTFVSESETHINCACTHLTEFSGQLDLNNVASAPSSAAIHATNDAYIAQRIAFETSKRAYYTTTVTPTPVTPVTEVKIIRDFAFPNIGLYFAAAIFVVYCLFMLFNLGNTRKNALKKFLDQGQSILVLTYHPILSMFIKAHTANSNTQLMRITKFFCMLESYAGLSSIFYLLLDLDLKLAGGAKLVISAIFTLIFGPLLCYSLELLYNKFKKRSQNKRRSSLYQYTHFILMIIWAGVTIGLVGLIRADYRSSWMGSFILVTVLDVIIFDLLVLIFAMMQKNNSKHLKLFKLRGYYVDTGAASIYTPEDEAALVAKMKRILHGDRSGADLGSSAVPGSAGIEGLVREIEDLNASNATDINAAELEDKVVGGEQPDQHEGILPDLENDEQADHEIPELMTSIAKASVRKPVMRNLSYKPKAPADKTRKPPVSTLKKK